LPRLRHFARGAGLPGGAAGTAIPFTSFVAYVESQPSGRRDHHWDDQHCVLLMDDICYERCFRMEGEFAEGMRYILGRLALTGPVVDEMLSERSNASPSDEPPVYTEDLAVRVHRLYARDFALFGYSAETWRGL
jgi:hypothetical protein